MTFDEDSILSHFRLLKEHDIYYFVSFLIIIAAVARSLWNSVLVHLISSALDRAGLDSTPFNVILQQRLRENQNVPPPPVGVVPAEADAVPVPVIDLDHDD